jgi:hypothetical protein
MCTNDDTGEKYGSEYVDYDGHALETIDQTNRYEGLVWYYGRVIYRFQSDFIRLIRDDEVQQQFLNIEKDRPTCFQPMMSIKTTIVRSKMVSYNDNSLFNKNVTRNRDKMMRFLL